MTDKQPQSRLIRAVLIGGTLAGLVDIGAAAMINGIDPMRVTRTIAGGLLGHSAHGGGPAISMLGLVLQVAMSIIIAAIYAAASVKLSAMIKWWWAWGLAYGVGVFFVMNYVVFPLSALRIWPSFTPTKLVENLLAMLVFALIVAFATHRGYASPQRR